jgi:hypothetical protein
MAKSVEKGVQMPSRPSLDQLEQVHELNRLFLAFLQSSARDDLDCLGLPPQARGPLRGANTAVLDSVAEFPRALFRLTFDERLPLAAIDPLRSRNDGARYAIALMILQSARTLSRQSTYHARLLMGLESRAIQRLRGLQLKELPGLAYAPHLVLCAFPEREWLWSELLTETRPEGRQRLALIALQPKLEHEWPRRRLAQLST